MKTVISNGKIITENNIIKGNIVIENGKIIDITTRKIYKDNNTKIIDANGKYISPGFIDLHTHGAGGYDFMDGTVKAYVGAAKKHMEYGTTSIMATTLASDLNELQNTIEIYKKACLETDIPNFIGMHLEGPYFAFSQKGAQDPKYLKNPDKKEYLEILNSTDVIKRWTIACELPGANKLGEELKKRGIIASIGHSDATFNQVKKAFDNGYNLLTHFYCAMSSIKKVDGIRVLGAVESGYLIDDMYVELIADGIHLPPNLLKMIYKIKGSDRICLVTDSMRGAGMKEGKSILGSLKKGQEVIIEGGVAKVIDKSCFAGSVCTADRLIRTMFKKADIPIVDAVKMLTLVPARIAKIEGIKGSLEIGKDADIIIFDDDINVELVMINGKILLNK